MTCESYLLGKMPKSSITRHPERVPQVLDLIHTNICGPINEMAHGGFHYFITFTNDHSRYGYVDLMKDKCESLDKFIKYNSLVENQTNNHIKTLRSIMVGSI